MKALLGDRISTGEYSPIRTPYNTNIVVTLPVKFDVLNARLSAVGVDLQRELPGVSPADYVKQVLGYAHTQYIQTILELGLGNVTTVLTKLQNRRTYVMPKHDHAGAELNKYGGVETGSMHLAFTPGYSNQMYDIRNSVYVADKIVDITGEGQPIIGSSEKSMIIALSQIYAMQPIQFSGGILYIGDVTCRLAVNVTMDDSLPRMDRVEDVSVLHIGSGLKAIEGITYLYQELHG